MFVKYVGKSTVGVEVVLPDGSEVHADLFEVIEVPDDVGVQLVAQRWEEIKPPKTPKAAKADTPQEDD